MEGLIISLYDVRSLSCVLLLALAAFVAGPARGADAAPILVVGDSLSAAYGIARDEGWVALLERRLRVQGYGQPVINASVSGDTSRGALARLPALLDGHRPGVVIIEIGGNDGLRGLPLDVLRSNLSSMIEAAEKADARVLLLGMRIPPNYGPRYAEGFREIYEDLSDRYDAALVPFLLEGVALDPKLMQDDGIHPRAAAQPMMLDLVWPALEPLLAETGDRASSGAAAEAAPAHQ
jgi:acyl-CoA thioesterase-1